ncbi:hypothetical protein G5A78_01300 [[Clostridium] scindens]|uniref:hypothetical protein n=1 Tax=Clostridium scindens (strain JCM 10418 / VPI 12708) TaxID=29347 RepID=UPI00156F28D5|nr:hypothetical protein [[Clostridium] scindens]NSJ13514.1 hypothetical protein [[Clostridium] scindens]
MIQVLTYYGNDEKYRGKDVIVNSLHDAQSLDEFEINIIDLSSQSFWENNERNTDTINKINDFKSISVMIDNSERTNIVIILPQNIQYTYNMRYDDRHWARYELKDILMKFKVILGKMYAPIGDLNIVYENTSTRIETRDVTASFYFNGIDEHIFTKSIKSNKATTIGYGDVILSTLNISDYEELIAFLRTIGLIEDRQKSPKWMEEVKMFDDEKQIDIIRDNQTKIQEAKGNIEKAKKAIDKNNEYKSILYTNGDELVRIVLEILEKMLGCDFSGFEDMKNEDFLTTVSDHTFIGEIKGVNHNVKSENVAQLDRHYQSYLDDNPDVNEDKISALLIMNHQKNKPIPDREVVHERQIALAERNGSLIIETYALLKLFEKYLLGDKTREQCIEILSGNTGLLRI